MALPSGAPEEVVRAEGGHGGVLVDRGVGVRERGPRNADVAQHGREPQAVAVLVHGRVPGVVRDELERNLPSPADAGDQVHHVVVVDEEPGHSGVLPADLRLQLVQVLELQVGADELQARLLPGREREIERAPVHHRLVLVHVAAGGVDPLQREAAGRGLRGVLERHRPALRPQVPVPDHLGEGDGHQEAAALEHHRSHRQLAPGEVEPRVARAVVVADDREELLAGRRDVVLLVAVVEGAAHAQLQRAHGELDPRTDLEEGAVLVHQARNVGRDASTAAGARDVLRPLVPGERVPGEAEGLLLLLLVDGRRVLGGSGPGESERGDRGGGESGSSHAFGLLRLAMSPDCTRPSPGLV